MCLDLDLAFQLLMKKRKRICLKTVLYIHVLFLYLVMFYNISIVYYCVTILSLKHDLVSYKKA